MKVTHQKLPDSQIGLEIEISGQVSQTTYEKVIKDLSRSSNIPGFRRGKVPRNILLQRLGKERVKAAALEEIIQTSIKDAIEQEAIESLGNFQLRSDFDELVEQFKPGEAIIFSASVDVPPTVKLGDYQSLSVTAEAIAYDPQKVEDWLQDLREKQATLVPVEDCPAALGNVVIGDYEGYHVSESGGVGDPIPEVQGIDLRVDLEPGRFIEGMVEGIVGMSLEETKEIPLKFPEDYPLEAVAGKEVIFRLTLKELKAKELPALDDEFAEEVSEFETIAELRESREKQVQEEAEKATKSNIETQIIQELRKICSVDLPETLVNQEINEILTQILIEWQQMGIEVQKLVNADTIPEMRKSTRPDAIAKLQQNLILKEVAAAESLTVTEEALEARIQEVLPQLSQESVDLDKLREILEQELLQQKTLDWLQEQIKVELVPEGSLSEAEAETTAVSKTDEEE